ncbi:MAG: hypothetical protein AAGF11_41050 [Myxococcota bacterium]
MRGTGLLALALVLGCGYHEYVLTDGGASEGTADTASEATESEPVASEQVEAVCTNLCDMIWTCDPGPPFSTIAECEMNCQEDVLTPAPDDCTAARLMLNACVGGLDCTDYFAYVNADPPGEFPCAQEASVIAPLCP